MRENIGRRIRFDDNGALVCDKSAKAFFVRQARRLTAKLGCKIPPEYVALGQIINVWLEGEPKDSLDECVEWVLCRCREQPESRITPMEVAQIGRRGRLPALAVARLSVKIEDNALAFDFLPSAIAVFQSPVAWLQEQLKYPVEYHHVLAALVPNVPLGTSFISAKQLNSLEMRELLLTSLKQTLEANGTLLSVCHSAEECDEQNDDRP